MQGTKRPYESTLPETVQMNKQSYTPRYTRPTFPPRGTAPKPIYSNAATSSTTEYEDEVDKFNNEEMI
jgi:hypothetical protein